MTTYEMYSEVYNKNAERMYRAQKLAEMFRKQGNTELARKYRAEYTELKAEIDSYCMAYNLNK